MSNTHPDMQSGIEAENLAPLPREETLRRLDDGWVLCLTDPDACAVPSDLPATADFIPAFVPGTVAQALEAAGRYDRANPQPLDGHDAWYILRLDSSDVGQAVLRFEGLATVCEVYLNGTRILSSESMFVAHYVPVLLEGSDQLALCFRAMEPRFGRKGQRARWRPQMITPAGVRLFRTTTLGRMPGWCPEVHAIGPYRPVSLAGVLHAVPRISARLDDSGRGLLRVSVANAPDGSVVHCAGVSAELLGGDAMLVIPDVECWWPATHGRPVLHDVELERGDTRTLIGRAGFRRITVDRGADGLDFSLHVNGVPVFCRGAVWTNADIVCLPGGREDYRPWLEKAAAAHMNMVRIGGTMTYETADFFALCDELGLMVWQDLMLANFDYPAADENWMAAFKAEIEQFFWRTAGSPSLAVVCGGSEVYQQAAMLGLPASTYEAPLTEELIPALVAENRPDCVYVTNSPSGGAMPFSPNAGVTHYYGVGAYMRPLEDARRAEVRFAAETLAFAHVPEQATLDRHLPVPPVHDPRWKARVPRDRGASWDFEDVRDFYLGDLYGIDPQRLRRENMSLYLDLSRTVTGEVTEATFAEWRRKRSTCHGALIWTLQDLMPGAGWGLIDATGKPKPVWHAVRRAFRPLQIMLTDEGTNGVDIHAVNDGPAAREIVIEIACLRDGATPVVSGKRQMLLGPRAAISLPATELFGAFFDTAYAFRFGPASHDVTVARLLDADTAEELASAFHFPLGRAALSRDAQLHVELQESDQGFTLEVSTGRFAQNVEIHVDGYEASDNWFHLAPGAARRIALTGGTVRPSGEVRLAGGRGSVRF